jgi:hypothetical protein
MVTIRNLGCLLIILYGLATAAAQTSRPVLLLLPTKDATDLVLKELTSGDEVAVQQATKQIRLWTDHHHIPFHLWHEWLPALMKEEKYQDVADLALSASLSRPDVAGITGTTEWRARALLALDRPQEALQAAKSNYNVCDMKGTQKAIELVGEALATCHPDDDEIIRRFRNEQAIASGMGTDGGPASLPSAMLASVVIDPKPYAKAIKSWSIKTRFTDRASYANLLLAADRCQEAERVYRELYKLAATQQEIDLAVEGIARSLRAEDGTLARANTWLAALQQSSQSAATQPSH